MMRFVFILLAIVLLTGQVTKSRPGRGSRSRDVVTLEALSSTTAGTVDFFSNFGGYNLHRATSSTWWTGVTPPNRVTWNRIYCYVTNAPDDGTITCSLRYQANNITALSCVIDTDENWCEAYGHYQTDSDVGWKHLFYGLDVSGSPSIGMGASTVIVSGHAHEDI